MYSVLSTCQFPFLLLYLYSVGACGTFLPNCTVLLWVPPTPFLSRADHPDRGFYMFSINTPQSGAFQGEAGLT